MKIGEVIRAARKAKRLTQADLAQAIDVTVQAVSQWERGETRPNLFSARKIALALELERDWILNDDAIAQISGKVPKSRFASEYQGLVPLIDIDETTYFSRNIHFSKATLPKAQSLLKPTNPISGFAFAIVITDDAIAPRFIRGDVVIFSASLFPHDGDYVVSQVEEFPANHSVFGKFTFNGDEPFAYIHANGDHMPPYNSVGVGGTMVEHRRLRISEPDDIAF